MTALPPRPPFRLYRRPAPFTLSGFLGALREAEGRGGSGGVRDLVAAPGAIGRLERLLTADLSGADESLLEALLRGFEATLGARQLGAGVPTGHWRRLIWVAAAERVRHDRGEEDVEFTPLLLAMLERCRGDESVEALASEVGFDPTWPRTREWVSRDDDPERWRELVRLTVGTTIERVVVRWGAAARHDEARRMIMNHIGSVGAYAGPLPQLIANEHVDAAALDEIGERLLRSMQAVPQRMGYLQRLALVALRERGWHMPDALLPLLEGAARWDVSLAQATLDLPGVADREVVRRWLDTTTEPWLLATLVEHSDGAERARTLARLLDVVEADPDGWLAAGALRSVVRRLPAGAWDGLPRPLMARLLGVAPRELRVEILRRGVGRVARAGRMSGTATAPRPREGR